MTLRAELESITPMPYRPGESPRPEIVKSCCNELLSNSESSSVTATIVRVFTITIPPVMEVSLTANTGSELRVALELYDRRFGEDLRDIGHEGPNPLTAEKEAGFQSFVRQGKMAPFLQDLKEKNQLLKDIWQIPVHASSFATYENGDYEDDKISRSINAIHQSDLTAKYEAALWQDCNEHFDCETKVYERLRDLQGKSVPRLFGHVRLRRDDIAADLKQSSTESYFEVKRILLGVH